MDYWTIRLKVVNNASVPVLFADDASMLFTHHKTGSLNADMYNAFKIINKWFRANILSLNYEKPFNLEHKMLCKLIARLYMVII